MLTEIEHAASWWASQLAKPTPKQTAAFKQALIAELSTRYTGHWFADDAQRGCAYRCISYDHRLDSTLIRAAQIAQLDNIETLLIKARWHSMFVNPGLVKVQNTQNIATSPTIIYSVETSTSSSQSLAVPALTPRRSSLQLNHTRTVTFSAPDMAPVTPTVDVEPPVLTPIAPVNGLAPSLMPNASFAPKKSALKGHHRSKSTSPVSAPLSVRFNQFNQATTFTSTSPPQEVVKSTTPPPATTLAPPKPVSPTLQLAKPTSPPTTLIQTPPSPPALASRESSPKAVHHGSHSVDFNSALFANLTLNVKPSARTVTSTPTVTVTVTPPQAPAPTPAALDERILPIPTIFTHMTRMNKPTHHTSRSMCSFPYGWNSSSTYSPSSESELSPKSSTSMSLPRLVSHHRGLSTSLLPSALLVR